MGALFKTPKAPTPPDPVKVAGAQTATNVGTAIANQVLGQTNQITPDGALTYSQSGTYEYKDPLDGKVYNIPQYTATQTLSAAGQQIKAASDQADINMAGLARDQSARLGTLLSAPVDLSNEATEGRIIDLATRRLNPQIDRQRADLETRLSGQGIKLGSAAYDRAMGEFGETSNDALTQLLLTGRGQAVQEALTERNQPINEITALLSGSQVSQPNFIPTGGPQMPTTDVAGIYGQNYAQRMAGFNAQQASSNAKLGGLFSLGAAGIGAL